VCATEQMYPVL